MFLSKVTTYMLMTLILLLLILIIGVVLFILINRKKTSISEVYYDSFDRHDSLEYMKFDSIISSTPNDPLKGMGIMVVNKRTFVAAVAVTGYNFFTASYDTQVNTINAFISFMDTLEKPISLRQTVKAINISYNIEAHNKEIKRLTDEVSQLQFQIQNLIDDAEDHLDLNPALSDEYMDKAEELKKIMQRKSHQLEEAKEMVAYMKEISIESGDNQKVQHILFSYTYDGTQFTTQLSQEEICLEAITELSSKASSIISHVYRFGGSAKVETAEGLTELNYRHMHPVTSDEVSLKELLDSGIGALFVTSDSLFETIKEQLTKEQLEKRLKIAQQKLAEKEKRTHLMSNRAEQDRLDMLSKEAASQVTMITV